jgi:pSer/pThr/pTyr-binding forkhead associated (FHA) protein
MISKRHCALLTKGAQVFLKDFESTNGTFLNDEAVKGEVPVKDGDVLKVGPLAFKVVIDVAATVSKPTPPPKQKTAAEADEDAAAALLSIDELGRDETTEDKVPDGSTEMELPAYPLGEKPGEAEQPAAKPDDKKGPKKHQQGAAQDAAKAILEKLRQGKRK